MPSGDSDAPTAPLAAVDPTTPALGRTLGGKYTLTALIGEGGFGAVHRATQAPLGRLVAVKLLHRARHDPAELRRRFALEARALARLSAHPGCVALLDVGEEPDGQLYLVQAFVDGRPLDALLRERGPLPPARAVTLAAGVLDALDAAHHAGIVHRDVKPANVMLTVDHRGREQIKLLDFGIARLVDAAREGIGPSDADVIVGSVHCMAPEQFSGEGIGPATDLYAVGVLLYTLLTGAPPFTGSAVAVMHDHLTRPPPPLGAAAPPALQRVIARALAKAPADRYADAAEMRAALIGALDAAPVPQRWRPWWAAAAVIAAAALAALVLGRAPERGMTAGAMASPTAAVAAAMASPAAAGTPGAAASPAMASPGAAAPAAMASPATATSTASASPEAGTPAVMASPTPLIPEAPRAAASMTAPAVPAATPASKAAAAVPVTATPASKAAAAVPVTATPASKTAAAAPAAPTPAPRAAPTPPPRAAPTPAPPADARRAARDRVHETIDRCDCAAAGRQLAALALEPEDPLRRHYHEQCRRLGHACLKPR